MNFYLNIKFNQSLISKKIIDEFFNIVSNILKYHNENTFNVQIRDYIYIGNFLHYYENNNYIYFLHKYFEKLNIDFTYLNTNQFHLLYALEKYVLFKVRNNQIIYLRDILLNIIKNYKHININHLILHLTYKYHLNIIDIQKSEFLTEKDIFIMLKLFNYIHFI